MAEARVHGFPPLLYRGSVKDVYGVEGKSPYIFHYSDRYSIFDWGPMPNELANKGIALAFISDLFFRYLAQAKNWQSWEIPKELDAKLRESLLASAIWQDLRARGLQHHSRGLVDEEMHPVATGKSSAYLAVEACRVLRPSFDSQGGKATYNYSAYAARPVNALVPLEVIFRFGAPEGSSFLARAARDPNLIHEVGLSCQPSAGEWFARPIVEFSTKLEAMDRQLSYGEARAIAGLSDMEWARLTQVTLLLALRLRSIFAAVGVELWDGKFEFAFAPVAISPMGERDFILVDSIGPDELRLLKEGVHLSKELIRKVYRSSAWYRAVEEAKRLAAREGSKDWKKICLDRLHAQPQPLPRAAQESLSQLYPALTNAVAQGMGEAEPFPQAWNFSRLMAALQELPIL